MGQMEISPQGKIFSHANLTFDSGWSHEFECDIVSGV